MTADQVTTENLNFYRNRAAVHARPVTIAKSSGATEGGGLSKNV